MLSINTLKILIILLHTFLSTLGAIIATIFIFPILIIYDITGFMLFTGLVSYYEKCLRKLGNLKE